MKNVNLTERIVFTQEVEATEKTIKLPIKLIEVNLETGDAILNCIAFKDNNCKDKHVAAVDKFKADKIQLDKEIKSFETKYKKALPKLQGGGEMELRKSLKDERDSLQDRIKELKEPVLDTSEAMSGNFKVKIADVSIFNGLVSQIDK